MGVEYPSVRTVDIDLGQIEKIREKMPILEHRRRDLYSLTTPINIIVPINENNNEKISWGQIKITESQIFFRSTLCFALVNRKPVVPGRKFIFVSFFVFNTKFRCSRFACSLC